MRDKVERKAYVNIIYFVILGLILISNIFSGFFSKLLYLEPDIEKSSSTQIHFINVGQGDAIAIRFSNGEIMLIDSGTELYRKKLTRYLDNVVLSGNKIDYLVLTHTDLDHSGNMEYIVSNYDIGTFYRPPVYIKEENDAGERASNIGAECLRRKDGVGCSASVGFERNRTVNLLQQKEAKDLDPGTRALVRVRTDRSSLSFAFILTVK